MTFENFYNQLIVCFILLSLVAAIDELGDVSISKSKIFMKKNIYAPSVEPSFREKEVTRKILRARNILGLTTPIPSTVRPKPSRLPTTSKTKIFDFKRSKSKDSYGLLNNYYDRTDDWIDRHYDGLPEYDDYIYHAIENPFYYNVSKDTSVHNSKFDEGSIQLITHLPQVYDYHDNKIIDRNDRENRIGNYRQQSRNNKTIGSENRIENVEIEKNTYSKDEMNKLQDIRMYPIEALAPKIYVIKMFNSKNHKKIDRDNDVYRFVNQYKCDINVTTCGLWNDPKLKDMFSLMEIQNTVTKQRCWVADTSRARLARMFGARLITQYFHTFPKVDACFELKYFANGPGIVKMEIAQQDNDTRVIWSLKNYDFNVEINLERVESIKIPVKLNQSEPRFFITVNLDPKMIGRIGILGFNFTYSKCTDL